MDGKTGGRKDGQMDGRTPVTSVPSLPLSIRPMLAEDWPAVRRVYAEGIATGSATFDSEIPEWEEWSARHLAAARIVAERNGTVVGWAALMPVSPRACFRGVAEVSVYVGDSARGAGVGKALLSALITESERAGIWTLFSSIQADNPVSLALHEKCGFRLIGRRERLAQRNGVWKDTFNLERRSAVVGL
jgi:L-amino acid N-acyltransferase YncA